MTRKQIAHRQDVAMKMHAAFRCAGRAAGEGDQADVVSGGVARGEMVRFVDREGVERIGGIVMEQARLFQARAVELVLRIVAAREFIGQARVA